MWRDCDYDVSVWGYENPFEDPSYICDFCGHVSCNGDCIESYTAMEDREYEDRSEFEW